MISFVVSASVIAGVVSFLVTPIYRASTLLIPNVSQLGLNAALGELSGLVGQFGIGGSGEDPSRVYPEILQSRAMARTILEMSVVDRAGRSQRYLDRFDMKSDSQEAKIENATRAFLVRRSRTILNPKNNAIKIVVYDSDPEVAAQVANAMVAELDRVNQEINRSNARARREFIDSRRIKVAEELQTLEEALLQFHEENRQIQGSPQLKLEAERLERRVRVSEELYLTLTKELEVAKIDEVRDVPVISVLDRAVPPVECQSPRKRLIVVVTFVLATALGLVLAMIWESREAVRHGFATTVMHPGDQ